MSDPAQCPVCRARFRGARICSRCGADLEPLMRLAARAWMLREAARDALAAGAFGRARELAERAGKIQPGGAAEALGLLSVWLGESVSADP